MRSDLSLGQNWGIPDNCIHCGELRYIFDEQTSLSTSCLFRCSHTWDTLVWSLFSCQIWIYVYEQELKMNYFKSTLDIELDWYDSNYQIRSVAQLSPTLCDPMNRSTPGLPVILWLKRSVLCRVHIMTYYCANLGIAKFEDWSYFEGNKIHGWNTLLWRAQQIFWSHIYSKSVYYSKFHDRLGIYTSSVLRPIYLMTSQ